MSSGSGGSSSSGGSSKPALTISLSAPLRKSSRSAFHAFSRPISATPTLASQAASPSKNALASTPGTLLNQLQKLQLDLNDANSDPALPDPISIPAAIPAKPVDTAAEIPVEEESLLAARAHKPLHRTTLDLLDLFRTCNPAYSWTGAFQPRRVLTSPSVPSITNPHDNANNNLIMSVGDILWHNTEDSHVKLEKVKQNAGLKQGEKKRFVKSFKVMELLGEGTFGQVVKCEEVISLGGTTLSQQPAPPTHTASRSKVYRAIKVIKNKPAYYNQALMEIQILRNLNEKFDPENKHHLLRMIESFNCKGHLCLVFELLSVNLYDLMKQNGYRGLSWSLLRIFLKQILDAMGVLTQAKLIHCDLKPENILLNKLTAPDLTLIDFGSACFENQTVYSYIQSRFYRSPEVLCLPYGTEIALPSGEKLAIEHIKSQMQLVGEDGKSVHVASVRHRHEDEGVFDIVSFDETFKYAVTKSHLVTLRFNANPTFTMTRNHHHLQSHTLTLRYYVGTHGLHYMQPQSLDFTLQLLDTESTQLDQQHEIDIHNPSQSPLDSQSFQQHLTTSNILHSYQLHAFALSILSSLPRSSYLVSGDLIELPASELYQRRDEFHIGHLTVAPLVTGRRVPLPTTTKPTPRINSSSVTYQLFHPSSSSSPSYDTLQHLNALHSFIGIESIAAYRNEVRGDECSFLTSIRNSLQLPLPSSIIAFGRYTHSIWRDTIANGSLSDLIAHVESLHSFGVDGIRLTSASSNSSITVWFAPGPCDWSEIRFLSRALALAHGLDVATCDRLAASGRFESIPIRSVDWREGAQRVVSVEIDAKQETDKRFALANGLITHNCGLPYNSTIDAWSFGCIAAELYLGLPLFPGITQQNQLYRIIKFIGPPPASMLAKGKNTKKFFKIDATPEGITRYTLKTAEEYAAETRTEVAVHKTYFKGSHLKEVVDMYPMRKGLSDSQKLQEMEDRKSFLHFLQGFLRWDATQRWLPKQALQHPFLQRQPLATLDEHAFENLRYVIDQPTPIPQSLAPAPIASAVTAASIAASTTTTTTSTTTQSSTSSSSSSSLQHLEIPNSGNSAAVAPPLSPSIAALLTPQQLAERWQQQQQKGQLQKQQQQQPPPQQLPQPALVATSSQPSSLFSSLYTRPPQQQAQQPSMQPLSQQPLGGATQQQGGVAAFGLPLSAQSALLATAFMQQPYQAQQHSPQQQSYAYLPQQTAQQQQQQAASQQQRYQQGQPQQQPYSGYGAPQQQQMPQGWQQQSQQQQQQQPTNYHVTAQHYTGPK